MDNKTFAQGLRELADIYEADERMAVPPKLDIDIFNVTPEVYRGAVRAISLGGKAEKLPARSPDEYFYRVKRELPSGVVVELVTQRSGVCRRVQKMQLVDTWECPDSILDPGAHDGR